jgi:hypothetical protein
MLQESAATSWDIRTLCYGPSTKVKLYLLFLLIASVATTAKLVRLWIAAPPFRLSRQAHNPAYLQQLEYARNSLKQWMAVTLVAWGIFTSVSVYDVCIKLLDQKAFGGLLLISIIADFSIALTLCLVVLLFTLLVHWHLMKRMECLQKF